MRLAIAKMLSMPALYIYSISAGDPQVSHWGPRPRTRGVSQLITSHACTYSKKTCVVGNHPSFSLHAPYQQVSEMNLTL